MTQVRKMELWAVVTEGGKLVAIQSHPDDRMGTPLVAPSYETAMQMVTAARTVSQTFGETLRLIRLAEVEVLERYEPQVAEPHELESEDLGDAG